MSSWPLDKETFFEHQALQGVALTYDDVRLAAGPSLVSAPDISLESKFSRNVELKIPIVSAAMDTVTESDMAIAMAKLGGLGVIHAGLGVHEQKREVRRTKLDRNALIDRPISVDYRDSVESVLSMCEERKFDFRTLLVTDEEGKLSGVLTQNDFDHCIDPSTPVKKAMTPLSGVSKAEAGTDIETAYKLMSKSKKKTLPLVDKDGKIAGLYVWSDVKRIMTDNPENYNLDENGQLRVAAAVPTDPEEAIERMETMNGYVDVVVIDTAQGDSRFAFQTLRTLVAAKEKYQNIDVVVGNVSSPASAVLLAEAGADGIKVGQGPGSICTTRTETGIGTPQVTAVYETARALIKRGFVGIPVCADGGITSPGDIPIAIAAKGHSVMLGGMLAGTDETPGQVVTIDGKMVKMYRGMGSPSALADSAASRKRYGATGPGKPLAEGVEKYVAYRGSVGDVVDHYVKALRKSMDYCGAPDIETHRKLTNLFRITNAGLRESQPHDVNVALIK